jgi:hypothetical protein
MTESHDNLPARSSQGRSTVLGDFALAAAMVIFIAGLCVVLVWLVPLGLVPPRPH